MSSTNLPKGYKLTEVGVIPEDWEVVNLDKIASIIDPQPDHRTPPEATGGEPYIGISDFINDTSVDWDGCRKIIPKALDKQQQSFYISSGDIIFGKIGTIGSPKFIPVTPFRYALSANVILIKPKFEPHFLMSWLKSSIVQKQINLELHSTSQPAFGILKMRDLLIAFPPFPEQRSIATALSDIDELLGKLDRLIAKKRDLKQAAMQQLLTGKKRLPGFGKGKGYQQTEVGLIPEDWEVKRLPEISWFQEGPGLRNWQFTSTGIKVINVTNLENGVLNLERTDRYISFSEFTRMYQHFAVDDGDIVMASSGNSYSKTAVVRSQDIPLVMNTSVIRFKPAKVTDYRFLWVLLTSPLFKDQIDLMITGGAQPNFGPYHLKRINFPTPTLPEQTAIAAILSDMDTEIAALEQRRNKTRDLKQAMMQELLTGRIRLV